MTDQPSAARTLDAIRDGGNNLQMAVRQRIIEAVAALDEGDFQLAHTRISEARQTVGMLAQAQQQLGIAANGRVVRVRDLEAGMVMTSVGVVAEVMQQGDCDTDACPGHFLVTVGDNAPMLLEGDTAIFVDVAAPTDEP